MAIELQRRKELKADNDDIEEMKTRKEEIRKAFQDKGINENGLGNLEDIYLQFLSGKDMDLSKFTQSELSEIEEIIDTSGLGKKFKKQFH